VKSIDILAQEIDRAEDAQQTAAMAYSRTRNEAYLRRARALTIRLDGLKQQYAVLDAQQTIAQASRHFTPFPPVQKKGGRR